MFRYLLLILFVLSVGMARSQKPAEPPKVSKRTYVATDAASGQNGPKPYVTPRKYRRIEQSSRYLEMRDGVKLAVNLNLPADLEPGEKVPAIIYQTRYWRGAQFKWPFKGILTNFSGKTGKMMKEVILRGYALVAVDVRGSGASMGTQPYPWTPDEIRDGYEIVDWAVKQPWCSGKVGAAGISYSGTTAEFLATTQHPAIKAVVPMFSLYDVYDDISVPGGTQLEYFTSNWGAANTALDNNKLPGKDPLAKMAVAGVQPVKGERALLKEAVRQHQANLNVNDGVRSIVYRDDISKVDGVTSPDRFSPHKKSALIDEAGIAVYSISGYYDGNYQHAAVKRFLTLKNPANKLILGPWEHGGWMNCSPHNPGPAAFDKASEILKFFDYHLKGIDNGIRSEPRVFYYTMGEEKWKSADEWPPAGSGYTNYFFTDTKELSPKPPEATESFTPYRVDSTFGTGIYARWRSLLGKLKTPYAYYDWNERSRNLPHFTTSPLTADLEVTGHAVIHLYVSTDLEDGAFFAYLEDVDENGKATYVTEGQLRGLQRHVSQEPRPHNDVAEVPYHSYLRKDGKPMEPGRVEHITFDLYPVSYLFRKGHSIRISLSGGDKDHFTPVLPYAQWKIHHDARHASYVALPVMRK